MSDIGCTRRQAITGKAMKHSCPSCWNITRAVRDVTLQSLLSDTASSTTGDFQGFRFCPDGSCELLYFHPERSLCFTKDAIDIAVFQKSKSPQRLVCYCFGHSVAEIDAEVRDTGSSNAVASITENCRQGTDLCPETNPQGSCCLGNVRSVVALAKTRYGNAGTSDVPGMNPQKEISCCCTSEPKENL